MRIAVDVQPLLGGKLTGVGYYQVNLLKAVMAEDTENEYVLNFFSLRHTQDKIARLRELFGEDVKIKPCRWFSYALLHRLWLILPLPYRWFFRQKAEVSLFFNYYVPPFAEGKVCSVVYDTVVNDMPETMDKRTHRALSLTLKKSIQRCDRVITISEFSRERVMYHYNTPEDKMCVVLCGIDHDEFNTFHSAESTAECKSKFGISGDYLLYLGTLEPRKNISGLIDAYKLLCDKQPDSPKLVIAGGKGWLYDSIFERVKEYGLEDRVIFTGYVSDAEAPLLMSGAKVFCFPSFYEGFGMPPLEAMACGTPAIVSDRSSLPEVVGDAALIVDPDDAQQMAETLQRVLNDDVLRNNLIDEGIAQAGKFTWKKSAEAFINEVIKK